MTCHSFKIACRNITNRLSNDMFLFFLFFSFSFVFLFLSFFLSFRARITCSWTCLCLTNDGIQLEFESSQLPQTGRASMSVVEVDDPQLVILLHFMTPFMAIQPIFESPLARPASLQGSMASQLLIDLLRDRPGAHGMLLVSIEQDGKPHQFMSSQFFQVFYAFYIICKGRCWFGPCSS